jgi:hypothetical protein
MPTNTDPSFQEPLPGGAEGTAAPAEVSEPPPQATVTQNVFAGMANAVLDEFYPNPIPPVELYHYTTSEGLKGIIETNSLRCGEAAYMNDGSEIVYAHGVVRNVLEEFMRDKSDEDRNRANKIWNILQEQAGYFRPVIFCLCQEDNLLNQWRDYGRDIVPYSIALSPQQLIAQGYWNFVAMLFPMIYNHDEQITLTRALIERLSLRGANMAPEEYDTPEKITANEVTVASEIQFLLYRFKHPSFQAEKEWRMMSPASFITEPPKFRTGPLGIVPYYEWKPVAGNKLPITSVTVGPSPYAQVSDWALKQFLAHHGYDPEKTRYSVIPIRR